ncbi:hypothetical protein EDD22DRAFT_955078 [Suillus occidentalis]|nr:hypothetical protein EDD22DRAFT_955078 [Suillus occidentalis]
MPQVSGTDDAEDSDQLTHNTGQPPPRIDAIGPIEGEKVNIEPLAELPSEMEVLVLVSLFHGYYKSNRYGHSSEEERGKLIAMTVFGFLFYFLTEMACLISPACPFQIPILTMLHIVSALRRLGANATPTFPKPT